MTDETAAAPTEENQAEDAKPESLLFNRADAKLLLVTFAGTVAANIVTVMVVAVAIILVRKPGTSHALPAPPGLVPTALITCLAVAVLTIGATWVRKRWFASDPGARVMLWMLWLSAAFLIMIFVLILLGYAVGVK
jgi:hypothetical protein